MSDAPATKRDLDQAVADLRGEMGELRQDLRGEMNAMENSLHGEMGAMENRLHGEMSAMENRLVHQIGQAGAQVANVMMEQIRTLVSVVEEKYQDLPPQQAKLRADFDGHASDHRLHVRVPTMPPKRTRRTRPR